METDRMSDGPPDITAIATAELQQDLADSIADIATCELALLHGITRYSGGLVYKRRDANRRFVRVITAELHRRGVEPCQKLSS